MGSEKTVWAAIGLGDAYTTSWEVPILSQGEAQARLQAFCPEQLADRVDIGRGNSAFETIEAAE